MDAPALLKAAKNILGLGKIQSMPEGFPFCPGRLDKKEQGAHIFGTSVHTREQIPLPQGTSPPFPSKPSSKMTAAEGNMQQVQGEVCSPGKARLGGAWVLPRVWSCALLPMPALPSPQTPKCSSAPPSHPTEIFLTNFPSEDFFCSAPWSTGNNSPPSFFQDPLFKESHSERMVFQFSQGFLPHRALSQKIFFFPYLLYSPQFLLCFNFSLAYFKVLKLEAKWASMSSEGELRAGTCYKGNPKHPRLKSL